MYLIWSFVLIFVSSPISIQWFECLIIPYIIISTVTEVLLSRVLLRGLKPCSSIASLSLDADDNEVWRRDRLKSKMFFDLRLFLVLFVFLSVIMGGADWGEVGKKAWWKEDLGRRLLVSVERCHSGISDVTSTHLHLNMESFKCFR